MSKGFLLKTAPNKYATYWVARYTQDNEDEPFCVVQTKISYKQGQDKEQAMLRHCHHIFKNEPEVWEVLVHQGPEDTPQSGEQIVARLSREPFDGAEELTV